MTDHSEGEPLRRIAEGISQGEKVDDHIAQLPEQLRGRLAIAIKQAANVLDAPPVQKVENDESARAARAYDSIMAEADALAAGRDQQPPNGAEKAKRLAVSALMSLRRDRGSVVLNLPNQRARQLVEDIFEVMGLPPRFTVPGDEGTDRTIIDDDHTLIATPSVRVREALGNPAMVQTFVSSNPLAAAERIRAMIQERGYLAEVHPDIDHRRGPPDSFAGVSNNMFGKKEGGIAFGVRRPVPEQIRRSGLPAPYKRKS